MARDHRCIAFVLVVFVRDPIIRSKRLSRAILSRHRSDIFCGRNWRVEKVVKGIIRVAWTLNTVTNSQKRVVSCYQ